MTRMLIVEDDPSSAESLVELLHESGYDEVRVVHSAAEALETAVEFVPSIVFLDIELPDMSGYDVALLLHQHRHLQDMRLIALTSSGEHPAREHARASGFERYLVKPVTAAAVQEVLSTLLGSGERKA
jgi:CheY-like chemotaxis protein